MSRTESRNDGARRDAPDTFADRLARTIILGGVSLIVVYAFADGFVRNWFG